MFAKLSHHGLGVVQLKYEVELSVLSLKMSKPIETLMFVKWTRGSHESKSSECKGVKGEYQFPVKPMKISCTMYKKKDKFQEKKAKLSVKQLINKKEESIGNVEFDLAAYCSEEKTYDNIKMKLQKCSDKEAYLTVRIKTRWEKNANPNDFDPPSDIEGSRNSSVNSTGSNQDKKEEEDEDEDGDEEHLRSFTGDDEDDDPKPRSKKADVKRAPSTSKATLAKATKKPASSEEDEEDDDLSDEEPSKPTPTRQPPNGKTAIKSPQKQQPKPVQSSEEEEDDEDVEEDIEDLRDMKNKTKPATTPQKKPPAKKAESEEEEEEEEEDDADHDEPDEEEQQPVKPKPGSRGASAAKKPSSAAADSLANRIGSRRRDDDDDDDDDDIRARITKPVTAKKPTHDSEEEEDDEDEAPPKPHRSAAALNQKNGAGAGARPSPSPTAASTSAPAKPSPSPTATASAPSNGRKPSTLTSDSDDESIPTKSLPRDEGLMSALFATGGSARKKIMDKQDDKKQDKGSKSQENNTSSSTTSSVKTAPPSIPSLITAAEAQYKGSFSYFTSTLYQIMERQRKKEPTLKLEIPVLLDALIRGIEKNNGLKTEGIFRTTPHLPARDQLKEQLVRGDFNIRERDPHILASVIKVWLAELALPLIPPLLHARAIEIGKQGLEDIEKDSNEDWDDTDDSNRKVRFADGDDKNLSPTQQLKRVVMDLPVLTRHTLQAIVDLLYRACQPSNAVKNKMSYHSMGVVFAPALLRPEKDPKKAAYEQFQDVQHMVNFVNRLIRAAPQIQKTLSIPDVIGDFDDSIDIAEMNKQPKQPTSRELLIGDAIQADKDKKAGKDSKAEKDKKEREAAEREAAEKEKEREAREKKEREEKYRQDRLAREKEIADKREKERLAAEEAAAAAKAKKQEEERKAKKQEEERAKAEEEKKRQDKAKADAAAAKKKQIESEDEEDEDEDEDDAEQEASDEDQQPAAKVKSPTGKQRKDIEDNTSAKQQAVQIALLTAELAETKRLLKEKETTSTTSSTSSSNKGLERQLAVAVGELKENVILVEDLKEKVKKLELEKSHTQQNLEDTKRLLEFERESSTKNAESQQLTKQYQSLLKEKTKLAKENEQLHQELSESEEREKELEKALRDSEKALKEAERARVAATAAAATAQATATPAPTSPSRRRGSGADTQQEIEFLKETMETMKDEYQTKIESLQEQNKSVNQLVAQLRAESESLLRREMKFNELNLDKKSMDPKKKDKATLNAIDGYNAALKRIQFYEEQLRESDETLLTAKQTWSSARQMLEEEVKTLELQLQETKALLADASSGRGLDYAKFETLQKRLDKSEKARARLQEQVKQLETELETKKVELQTALSSIVDLEADNKNIQNELVRTGLALKTLADDNFEMKEYIRMALHSKGKKTKNLPNMSTS